MARADKPLPESPSQTAGPYVHIGCMPNYSGIEGIYAVDPGRRKLDTNTSGERISICGHIYDGEGAPLTDAVMPDDTSTVRHTEIRPPPPPEPKLGDQLPPMALRTPPPPAKVLHLR